jgi:hypothetical protein
MPPQEQDLWAYANSQNKNSTKCFECSVIKKDIKDPFKKNSEAIGKMMTKSAQEHRKGLSCFSSFAKSTLTQQDINTINSSLSTVVANQKKNGQAAAQLLQKVGNVFIARRRFLCLPNDARAKLISANETNTGNARDFTYNSDEVSSIVNSFINYFQTKVSTISSLANEISSMTDVASNSAQCQESTPATLLRYLQGSPSNSTMNNTNPNSGARPSGESGARPSGESGARPSGESGAKPSGASSSKPTGKKNGKSLGSDVTSAVSSVSSAISNLKSQGALDFATRISSSFNGETAQNCQPSGFNNFASNLALSGNAKTTLLNLVKKNSLCSADTIYIFNNGQLTCEGSCGSNFTTTNLGFVDSQKVSKSYYFASGCAGGSRFFYGTWSDLVAADKIYTSFKYKEIDSDKRCLSKAAGCVPGGKMKGGNENDGPCSSMSSKCSDELNKKCSATNLAGQTIAPPSGLPPLCDAAAQGLDPTSDTFINGCFRWIAKTFIRRSLSFSPSQIVSDTVITDAAPARLLQEGDVTIIPASQDSSLSNNEFSDIVLVASDIQVDGSSPDSVGSTNDRLNQIASDSLSSSTIKMSILSVIALFLFMI